MSQGSSRAPVGNITGSGSTRPDKSEYEALMDAESVKQVDATEQASGVEIHDWLDFSVAGTFFIGFVRISSIVNFSPEIKI